MMVDLAQHGKEGPVQAREISRRQNISIKYTEKLIIPLKQACFIKSFRGPKGGHMLAMPAQDITVAQIIRVLEGNTDLSLCIENPGICDKADSCVTRHIWERATRAMYDELETITLADLISMKPESECSKGQEPV